MSNVAAPLDGEQTRAWVMRYQRQSKIYAWGFFLVLLPVVFGVIWWSMGELNAEVFYAWLFFAVLTFILAVFSRRNAKRSWTGSVMDKGVRQQRIRSSNPDHPDHYETYSEVVIRTTRGRKIKLRCTPAYMDYVNPGDQVFKVPGFSWPEKVTLDGHRRLCISCGQVLDAGAPSCQRCKAPMPDHQTIHALARP